MATAWGSSVLATSQSHVRVDPRALALEMGIEKTISKAGNIQEAEAYLAKEGLVIEGCAVADGSRRYRTMPMACLANYMLFWCRRS